jgi:HlyD family secretion protein
MKLNKKFLFVIAVVILAAGFFIYSRLKPKSLVYEASQAARGALVQEVSETGTVKKGDLLNLNFKSPGKIKSIDVSVGQSVPAGQKLASLDTSELEIQARQARANLGYQQANLDKLMAGASSDDVKISQTAVQNEQIAADNARQTLTDAIDVAAKKASAVYQTGYDDLQSAYTAAYNAQNFIGLLQRTYFTPRDDDSILVWEDSQKIFNKTASMKAAIDNITSNQAFGAIDTALAADGKTLADISDLSLAIRNICESITWRNTISIADRGSLDGQRSYVVAALAQINGIIETISSAKAANDSSVNAAQAALALTDGQLKSSQNSLAKVTAAPRDNDIKILQSQIAASRAQVELLSAQIADGVLAAPANGQISDVNGQSGEIAPVSGSLIVLVPDSIMTIDAAIPEMEIARIASGNQCNITFDAFPGQQFSGKVTRIDPSQTVVAGVVYYEIAVSLDDQNGAIKPGMTANLDIVTAQVADALKIPSRAIIERDGKKFVSVPDGNATKEVQIETGLSNTTGETQVISGLKEGDAVITYMKNN